MHAGRESESVKHISFEASINNSFRMICRKRNLAVHFSQIIKIKVEGKMGDTSCYV